MFELFFGREKELSKLEQQYQSDKFEFPVIYGRRRVGKTELIKHFLQDKKAIYFQGIAGTDKQNLEALAKTIFEYRNKSFSDELTYQSMAGALDDITALMKAEKLVFVIDEFPYLAEASPSISSLLQYYIDHQWKALDSMLILCGSSMSFIEKQVLSAKSPLYGRDITRYKLFPFTFKETKYFLDNVSIQDAVAYYAMTNGVPYYLGLINQNQSVMENIESLFLDNTAKLFEEPLNLLNMEVRDPSLYLAILNAVAAGNNKYNEISTKTGLSSSHIAPLLGNLIELGLIEKISPLPTGSKKGLYQIKDGLYRFWFTFVSPNVNFIEIGRIQAVKMMIEARFTTFLGPIFEDICRSWLIDESDNKKLPLMLTDVGRWWGGNPKTKQQEEIDITGIGIKEDELLLGECKWTSQSPTLPMLEKLIDRSRLFNHRHKYMYFFSKVAFSDRVIAFAKTEHIRLITLDNLY
ncbi:ATP-binding protein [Lactococcus paracarnosus]|uniref:ATP-binding protein n=1 Tax=Pseudolactococcus paracarnosus TaxID=2749962 RepID=A0ABT0AIK4_9LACT|nr:ATP-binding protein [Lactococcus paracarnosus]MCJ1982932.1 ATP-binding protein [Lactococcus paracarnosus]MCJ1998424.1 ATP-binding protein [Lactococcus paracarnosus]